MFIKFLEQLEYIKPFSNYNEYSNYSHYEFETFALNHHIQITGEIKLSEYPPENMKECISYIEQRASTTFNKVLRARYNDIIWSYKKLYDTSILISENVRDKCELAISDYIDLAKKYILHREDDKNLISNLINYLFRAWNLCRHIKSAQQTELIQLMIDIENSIDEDKSIGLWGFCFKKLIADNSVSLSLDQESEIINKIKQRNENLDGQDYQALEYGIKFLLEYYKNKPTKQLKYFDILIRNAHIKSDRPFENQNRFKNIIQLCHRYRFKELKEQAILNYQLHGADIDKFMVRIEQKFELTSDMQQELIELLSNKSPYIHFLNIANYFITSKSRLEERNEENSRNFYLRNLFQTVITNNDGVTIKALSTKDDELYHANKLYWQINSILFNIAIKNFIDTHQLSYEDFKDLIFDEILYKNHELSLLAAIKALYNRDYYSMCYISVPIIENAFRQLLFQCDHSIYEENKHDGFENITLSRILTKLEVYLTEDIIFHLKFVLNEKAGLNLRNDLSHGLLNDSQIHETTAFTILHMFMTLKLIVGFPK